MSTAKMYVGNLSYSVDEGKLNEVFSAHGNVKSVNLITDYGTGRSKGFAFVEMSSREEMEAASAALNGKDLDGRAMKVNEAKPKTEGDRGGRRRY